jgi:preprotein translocase subunit SecD
MNRYPAWLNALVVLLLLLGVVLALPNVYGTGPAVQLAGLDGAALDEPKLAEVRTFLDDRDLDAEAVYLDDERIVLRFHDVVTQQAAGEALRSRYQGEASVALTLTPRLPAWLRGLGLCGVKLVTPSITLPVAWANLNGPLERVLMLQPGE